MYLIVGLGNPGREYVETRHNMGFAMIDYIATKRGLEINCEKFGGLYIQDNINGERVILLKPQKYINLSGMVIKSYVDFYKIPIENILIINDDMDLDVGNYKLRMGGGSAGHNGLKNIAECLGTENYKRIKIGISKESKIEKKDYVLGKLSKEEVEKIQHIKDEIVNMYNDLFLMTFSNLMNKYNK